MLSRIVKTALASNPGWRSSAVLRAPGLIIVMYHRVKRGGESFSGLPVESFRAHVQWLKRRCQVISADEMLEALGEPRRLRPAVLLTFDDGFKDYHDNVYPILHEFRVPALVFVTTACLDDGGMLWTDRLHYCATRAGNRRIDLPWAPGLKHDLTDLGQRADFISKAKSHLKGLPDEERRRLLEMIIASLDTGDTAGDAGRQMLTWHEVAAVRELTTIGGHTHTHPILSQLTRAQVEQEVRNCYERISAETGTPPRHFAYPNGRAVDFNDDVVEIVRRQGFSSACTTISGVNRSDADPFRLRRQPGDGLTTGDLARLLSVRGKPSGRTVR